MISPTQIAFVLGHLITDNIWLHMNCCIPCIVEGLEKRVLWP